MNGVWALSDNILWRISELMFSPAILLALLIVSLVAAKAFFGRNID
jgi:hypothetical protein